MDKDKGVGDCILVLSQQHANNCFSESVVSVVFKLQAHICIGIGCLNFGPVAPNRHVAVR